MFSTLLVVLGSRKSFEDAGCANMHVVSSNINMFCFLMKVVAADAMNIFTRWWGAGRLSWPDIKISITRVNLFIVVTFNQIFLIFKKSRDLDIDQTKKIFQLYTIRRFYVHM